MVQQPCEHRIMIRCQRQGRIPPFPGVDICTLRYEGLHFKQRSRPRGLDQPLIDFTLNLHQPHSSKRSGSL